MGEGGDGVGGEFGMGRSDSVYGKEADGEYVIGWW